MYDIAGASLEPEHVHNILRLIASPTSTLPSAIFAASLFRHEPSGFLFLVRHILTPVKSISATLCTVKSVEFSRYHTDGPTLIRFAAFARSTLHTLPSE